MPYEEWKAKYQKRREPGAEGGLRRGQPQALNATAGLLSPAGVAIAASRRRRAPPRARRAVAAEAQDLAQAERLEGQRRRLEDQSDPGDPSRRHVMHHEIDGADMQAVADRRRAVEPPAQEVGQRLVALAWQRRQAIEIRDLADLRGGVEHEIAQRIGGAAPGRRAGREEPIELVDCSSGTMAKTTSPGRRRSSAAWLVASPSRRTAMNSGALRQRRIRHVALERRRRRGHAINQNVAALPGRELEFQPVGCVGPGGSSRPSQRTAARPSSPAASRRRARRRRRC